jgi:RNA polymerase sigma factor (sigma-70 family)
MLTPEQQKTIEESQWIVNLALKKQGLSRDQDLRQNAMLYLCRCIEHYDPSLDIKWSTYAFKSVYFYIKRTHAKQMKRQELLLDPEEIENLGQERNETECFEETMKVREIRAVCTPKERDVLDLKLKGYKHGEMSEILNRSCITVGVHWRNIKQKAREL